jgi:hypothetical protein
VPKEAMNLKIGCCNFERKRSKEPFKLNFELENTKTPISGLSMKSIIPDNFQMGTTRFHQNSETH